jgi:DNA mismatch repair ATPase MutS
MAAEAQLTPMMAQYRRIKSELPKDALLLYRLGDFYELFFEDAQRGAQLLNVALTQRQGIPMCGIPYHAANNYIGRLLKAGNKVAICDQTEEAKPGKLVERKVTAILSPGTHFDDRLLVAERNNFLAAVMSSGRTIGLALVDLTTGDFRITEFEEPRTLQAELERLRPAEIIFPGESSEIRELLSTSRAQLSGYDGWTFLNDSAFFTLRDHFKVASLDGFGLKSRPVAIGVAGAVLHYLKHHLRRDVSHLTRLHFYLVADYLVLDSTSLRNLEILEPLHSDASRNATLFTALNRTVTPMGARRLRDWLTQPLASVVSIGRRQSAVAAWLRNPWAMEKFRAALAEVRDLERTLSRLSLGSGNGRDLLSLRQALGQIPGLQKLLAEVLVSPPPGKGAAEMFHEPEFIPASTNDSGTRVSPAEPPHHEEAFGPVYASFRGQTDAAVTLLSQRRSGEVRGALPHPELGEIDLIWGRASDADGPGFGLALMFETHPSVVPELDRVVERLAVAEDSGGHIVLGSSGPEIPFGLVSRDGFRRWVFLSVDGLVESPLPDHQTSMIRENSSPGSVASAVLGALPLLADLSAQISALPGLVDHLSRAITDDPPLALKEGGLIRDGFSPELDELRGASRGGKDWIARLQQEEIARTGIPSLKIGFNSVFGYYIEITRANVSKVPPEYIRKQTIANGERFITQQLKEMESKILGAEERSTKLEYDLFLKVREEVLRHLKQIQATASALAQIDVLTSFAETARIHDWTRPEVGDEGVFSVRDGRHPVLERMQSEERFVPNDTDLDLLGQQIAIITGPNMAGKSTYIRQVALLALLAHLGSYVPAASARIDLLDRIFTRIGASDDLSRGQSTFMVEMSETANILNNATRRALVILDEIGRGTSTFDGLSLAWSIVEHLHNQVGAKTLFATHYHELAELAAKLPRVRNFHVAVREWNDQIIFLRKVHPGGTDKSYGIQVARLAGVPSPVIERAREILRVLEEAELNVQQLVGSGSGSDSGLVQPSGSTPPRAGNQAREGRKHRAEREKLKELAPPPQLDLFSSAA